MTPEDWREIDSLVQAAFDRPEEEREAFLAEACAHRPELREEVAALLDADAEADSFMDRPAGDLHGSPPPWADIPPGLPAEAPGPRPQPGSLFGNYRLIEEIGYGGFCRVYRAQLERQEFSQIVAVKVVDPCLDFGFGDDTGGDIAQRFRVERQILAQLDHPSIARLFDGGEISGRPYFVMEFVDGQAIDAYCADAKLDLEARIRLVLRVIDAVAYAHEHLIVHRDLKPGNLLVTHDGLPKLLDFGIAKVLEPEALALSFDATRSGLRPMTPAWAAPEQIRGEAVTTATDVYGMGLLLYYLLTGERAYELGEMTPSQMERAICDLEPEPPSRRLQEKPRGDKTPASEIAPKDATPARLEGDLDAIVMTALAKDPKRRYRTIRQLGEDLQRFLRHEPITARPATWLYRSSKWLQRHRWAASSALLAAVVLAGFVAALFRQSHILQTERDLARQESSRAEEVSRFLVEIFEEADPGRTQGQDLSVRRILDEGQAKVDRLREPAARTELLATLGSVHAGLGEVPAGAELLRRARREAVALYGPRHHRVAEIDHRLGKVLLDSDRFEAAEQAIRSALEIREEALGVDHGKTFETLALFGRLRTYQGFTYEGKDLLSRAVPGLERAGPRYQEAWIEFLGDLAEARRNTEQDGYLPLLEKRLLLARERLGERHPLVSETLIGLAFSKTDREEILSGLQEAYTLQEEVLGPDHPQQARISIALAFQYLYNEPARALELAQKAIDIDLRVWGEGTWALSIDRTAAANAHERLGDPEKAAEHWRLAVEDARLGTPITHSWRERILFFYLGFLLRQGELEEATVRLEELNQVRQGLPHRDEKWDVVPLTIEAIIAVRRGEEGAVERLRSYSGDTLKVLGRGYFAQMLNQMLQNIEQEANENPQEETLEAT